MVNENFVRSAHFRMYGQFDKRNQALLDKFKANITCKYYARLQHTWRPFHKWSQLLDICNAVVVLTAQFRM